MTLILLTMLRLLIPFFVFIFPVLSVIAVLFVDSLDWSYYPFKEGLTVLDYQNWDKLLDTATSTIFLIYLYKRWQSQHIRQIALFLFAWRVIGLLIFWITKWQGIFLLAPNVFDHFIFLLVIINPYIPNLEKNIYKPVLYRTVISFTFLKLIQEYLIHIANVYPWDWQAWQLFNSEVSILTHLNKLVWVILYFLIHVLVFWFIYKHNKND